uniref:Keratin, type II cytoskeletal 8 n=1 Tax=Periophthalmus magnuspinnatus TaxID=409849 RepID=A0A3B3Z967_9GOBI
LKAVDLALDLEDQMGNLDFLRVGFDEEIKELQSMIQNETLIIRDNNNRSLDMDEIIENAKRQYAEMAVRTRDQADLWNQKKIDELVYTAGKRETEVRELRRDISDMQRLVERLKGELETLIRRVSLSQKKHLKDPDQIGLELALKDKAQLEEALRKAKRDLARLLREHQDLMNLKLALDIEIATYRKLLEGEEKRNVFCAFSSRMNEFMRNGGKDTFLFELLIRVDVENGKVVSQSSSYEDEA